MDITTIKDLSVGDIIEGSDGPEYIIAICRETNTIRFANANHVMSGVGPFRKITRHLKGSVLFHAGVVVELARR